jgi:hypothetical protein
MMCAEDFSSLTVAQLKDRLRAANLPVSGRKAELIERLGRSSAVSAPVAPATFVGDAAAANGMPRVEIEASTV